MTLRPSHFRPARCTLAEPCETCRSGAGALCLMSDLLAIVRDKKMPAHILTFAAEELGAERDDSTAIAALASLISNHESALVREGAVYGIARHKHADPLVWNLLCAVAERDQSFGVRCAAADALED